jgi:hypothetical protein
VGELFAGGWGVRGAGRGARRRGIGRGEGGDEQSSPAKQRPADPRHINNVSYCRYVESARMKWIESLIPDLGEVGEDYLVSSRARRLS